MARLLPPSAADDASVQAIKVIIADFTRLARQEQTCQGEKPLALAARRWAARTAHGRPPAGWERHFLEAFGLTKNVLASAKRAQVSPSTVYRLRDRSAAFREAMDAAVAVVDGALYSVGYQRAMEAENPDAFRYWSAMMKARLPAEFREAQARAVAQDAQEPAPPVLPQDTVVEFSLDIETGNDEADSPAREALRDAAEEVQAEAEQDDDAREPPRHDTNGQPALSA